ncbi:MAG: NAD(P)-dependent oxidoreductase [Caldilineaceae bacterium]|nr:NAD(P)-dependent oxidoreductase [Caldilineaceae bacterium]
MILVTGATGMTGQYVVQELQRRGYTVRGLVRESSVDKANALGIAPVLGDLSDFASLHRAMADISGVVHVACTFTDSAIDLAAMGVLLDNWRQGPFVFISSLDVYGLTEENPIDEARPLREDYGDYGRGKVLAERLLAAKAAVMGRTDYTAIRAPHILGPHPKGYQRFLAKIPDGGTLLLPGADAAEWSTYRDAWIDVRDLAWVIAETVERPIGGALNVLSGHFSWHDFYAELIRKTGSSCQLQQKSLAAMTAEERAATESYACRWLFDDAKVRSRLNFQPQYTLPQTIDAMAQARNNGK